jgi:hypothetical protein
MDRPACTRPICDSCVTSCIVCIACAAPDLCLQHFPSLLHQIDSTQPRGDIDVKLIDFGTAQLCKDGCSVAEGISGTPGTDWEGGVLQGCKRTVCCCQQALCIALCT